MSKLYPESGPIPVPDFFSLHDTVKLAPAYLWVYIMRRAKQENLGMHCNAPPCLTFLIDYILTAIDRAVSQPGFAGIQFRPEHAAVINAFVMMHPDRNQVVTSKMDVSLVAMKRKNFEKFQLKNSTEMYVYKKTME